MSSLDKTTIIPDEDPSDILNKPIFKVVLLKDDIQLAKFADDAANNPPTPIDFQVLWFKNPDFAEIKSMFRDIDSDLQDVIAFSASKNNRVAHYIREGSRLGISIFRNAFMKAGYEEYNR